MNAIHQKAINFQNQLSELVSQEAIIEKHIKLKGNKRNEIIKAREKAVKQENRQIMKKINKTKSYFSKED